MGLRLLRRHIVIFLLALPANSWSQVPNGFEHLSISDGLSHNKVQCIVQDKSGYLWIGTYDGLNRFNGYSFDVFQKGSGNDSGLPDGNIYSLLVDRYGALWVGSKYGGLARFDPERETFDKWQHDPDDPTSISDDWIFTMYEDAMGEIWIGTSYGLNRIVFHETRNPNQRKIAFFERHYHTQDPDRKIQKIVQQEDILYLATSEGILLFDTQKKAYISSYLDRDNHTFKDKNDISGDILFPAPDSLILGAHSGMYHLDLKDSRLEPMTFDFQDKMEISRVNAILEDNEKNLWIGFNDGLILYDTKERRSQRFMHDFKNPGSLSDNQVLALYEDASGIVWIGTGAGVSKYDPNKAKFPLTHPEINLAPDQNTRSFKSAFTSSDGHDWIGNDSGLYEFSGGTLINSFVPDNNTYSISRGGVTKIMEMDNGDMMVATWGGGLNRLDRKTNRFHRYGYSFSEGMNTNDQLSCCITDMLKDANGTLWLSTLYGFLERFDSQKDTFKSFKLGEWIWDIWLDEGSQELFAATENGLVLFNVNTGQMEHFVHQEDNPNSIGHNRTWAVFNDSNNRIWVGTNRGLEAFDRNTNTFTLHTDTTLDHLSVYTILEDETGHLWLGTQNGISKFNPDRNVFRHFTEEDGAYPESKWAYKSPDKKMFFGGAGGFNHFDPTSIKINESIPEVVFTEFKIFNESVELGADSPLQRAINVSRRITLPYQSNVFSIEFASLNYSSTSKNNYAYRLEGFDEDWNYSGSRRTASYTNLNPGDYVFRVRGSNNDHVWNNEGASLKIHITPPFWGTWWFRISLVVFILAIVVVWFQVRFHQIRKKKLILEKLVRKRTGELEIINRSLEEQKQQVLVKNKALEVMAQEVSRSSQMRTNFFTNVSHEFRTPLTLIIAPLEKLLEETRNSPKINRSIELATKNSRRLLRLINQLLDVSKIDGGFMKLKLEEGNITALIEQIFHSFNFRAEKYNIQYKFFSELDSSRCYFDADKLEKIIYNLIDNAFKFTPEGGKIEVTLKGEYYRGVLKYVNITVSDTGSGIRPEDLKVIFERFVRSEEFSNWEGTSTSTGIGLSLVKSLAELHHGGITVESRENQGAIFMVKLGVDRNMYSDSRVEVSPLQDTGEGSMELADYEDYTDSLSENRMNELHQDSPLILIVEDNVELGHFMAMELSSFYNVIVARNGREGWKKCRQNLPDMVISDIMMPEMNGIELCKRIKEDAGTCHILTILLTAKATYEDQKIGLGIGADGYVTKPFNIAILHLKIRNLLQTKANMQKRLKKGGFAPELIVGDRRDKVLLDACVTLVNEEIANPDLDVHFLCKKIGISRSLLYSKMKAITGESVNAFIRNIRLQAAAEILLRYNDRPLGQIFTDVGFSNQSHFNRSFKEKYGVPPQKYRKLHLNESE